MAAPALTPLPVDGVVADVVAAEQGCVLVAPPGSGKTTRVPPALAAAVDGKVLLLQPRRAAARLVARRIAAEQGWRIGEHIGWRMRFDTRCGPRSRIEVLTEGVLTRMIQRDPFLEGVAAVILDEFHERSVHADLALALLAEIGARIVVMSATLDAAPVAAFLDVPVIRAAGRAFPVQITHEAAPLPALVRRHRSKTGHTLVFLPGVREIEALARATEDLSPIPLHGRLPAAAQDRALAPSATPKLVLSTNIAETSVTLEGVETVIDSGLVKIARFDPGSQTDRLDTMRVSRASADQRAGRAGRTAPGACVRAWSAKEPLEPSSPPEVARVDLAPAVLQLRAWGVDPLTFRWFERPPDGALRAALALVDRLPHRERLAELPLHPRLAAALLTGHARGCPRVIDALALLSLPGDGDLEAQTLTREARRVRDQLRRLSQRFGAWPSVETDIGPSLLAGFPDRAGLRRADTERYQLSDGQGARLRGGGPRLIIALETAGGSAASGRHREPHIRRWVGLESIPTSRRVVTEWRDGAARSSRIDAFGAVIVARHPGPAVTDETARALVRANCTPDDLGWDPELDRRVELARSVDSTLPPLDRAAVFEQATHAARSRADLAAFTGWLDGWTWNQRRRLDRLCPKRLVVPSGSRVRIRYTPQGPALSARVQQLFGWTDTPTIAGRALRIELLSPAGRPVQVTEDLGGFWTGSYAAVRREMRGRYPKHAWPEDPLTAKAEDRPRRR